MTFYAAAGVLHQQQMYLSVKTPTKAEKNAPLGLLGCVNCCRFIYHKVAPLGL